MVVQERDLQIIAEYLRPYVEQTYREPTPIVEWAENNFYIPETRMPIQLMPHQKIMLRLMFDNDFAASLGVVGGFQEIVYSTIKKSGKALDLDTLLPTPNGYKSMANIVTGDKVFDDNGDVCNVTYDTDVMYGHECYRVWFSDGSTLVADADHQWQVEALDNKYRTELITTKQMIPRLFRSDGAKNFRLNIAKPLQLPDASVPVAPYVLGAWLGDGNSSSGIITIGEEEIVTAINEYSATHRTCGVTALFSAPQYVIDHHFAGGSVADRAGTLTARLRHMNLLNNKHIPVNYLRASYEQRLSLLQGLMDTDGSITPESGECHFEQTNETLAHNFLELCASLGLKATMRIGQATLDGKDYGPKYRINFFTPANVAVFRLSRKLRYQKLEISRATRKHVAAIEPTKSVPVRCIQVDSPSHLYIADDAMTVTHNTSIAAMIGRWIGEEWGNNNEIFALANDLEQARGRIYQKIIDSIELDPKYDRSKRTLPGKWRIIERDVRNLENHSILRAVPMDYRGEAGSNPTATIWSELWGIKTESDKRLWDELTPVPTRPRSLRIVETYAGYTDESTLLLDIYKLGKSGIQLTRDHVPDWPFEDEYLLPIWVHPTARMFMYWDTGQRARRMPWQTPEYYRAQAVTLRPEAYNRLHENQWTTSSTALVPINWYDNCTEPLPPLDSRTPVVLAADASVSQDCTGLLAVTRHPTRTSDVAIRQEWLWTPPKGGKIDYTSTIDATIREFCKDHNVVEVAYDEFQLHKLMTDLMNDGVAYVKSFSQNNQRLVADKQLVDLIRERRLSHPGLPELRSHVENAGAKMQANDVTKLRIVKRNKDQHIDLAVCASMGAYECLRLML